MERESFDLQKNVLIFSNIASHLDTKNNLLIEVVYNKNKNGYFSFGEKIPSD